MKKIITIIIGLCCLGSVHAQWSITPEAGLSAVKRVNTEDWSARVRAGISVEYDFSQRFALKSGLYYADRGFTHNSMVNMSGSAEGENTIPVFLQTKPHQGYLQLPVLAKLGWNLTDDVRLTAAIGPYLGYQIHSGGDQWIYTNLYNSYGDGYGYGSGSGSGSGYGTTHHSLKDTDMGYKFDWGADLAVGLEVKDWVMNLTYQSALAKQNKYDEVKTKYFTFYLTIGYKFRL